MHSVFKNGFIQRNSFLCGLDVQLVKDIFALFSSSENCWNRGQVTGSHSVGWEKWKFSCRTFHTSKFTASFYAWERCFLIWDGVLILLIVLYIFKALDYDITGWNPYQCNFNRVKRVMVTSHVIVVSYI